MARQRVTMSRPYCDGEGCDINLLTQHAWLTTADGRELCISCAEKEEHAAEAAAGPRRPAWIDEDLERYRAEAKAAGKLPPAPAPDLKTRELIARADALLETIKRRHT